MPAYLNTRLISAVFILLWILLARMYMVRTPFNVRANDSEGHFEYTCIIANERFFPGPRHGWQTYHPPLYYWLNSFIRPTDERHIESVRYLSILYGVFSILILLRALKTFGSPFWMRWLVVGFIATTPAFVVCFTSYNNDSLVTVLSLAFAWLAYEYLTGRLHPYKAPPLIALAGGLALYSKLTAIFPVVSISFIVVVALALKKVAPLRVLLFLAAAGVALGSLIPWCVFHNAKFTGEWFPLNCVSGMDHLPYSPVRTFLTLPFFADELLNSPYVWEIWDYVKMRSYGAFVYSTSIFGAFPYPQVPQSLAWGIFWLHLYAYWTGIKRSLRHSETVVSIAAIVMMPFWSFWYTLTCPFSAAMAFRYIAWTWLPWAILYTAGLRRASSESGMRRRLKVGLFATTSVLHVVFLWTAVYF